MHATSAQHASWFGSGYSEMKAVFFSGNGKSREITRLSFKFLPPSHCARSVYYRKGVDLVFVTSISGKHLNTTKYRSSYNRTGSSVQLMLKSTTR
jgi:hypothetical protein